MLHRDGDGRTLQWLLALRGVRQVRLYKGSLRQSHDGTVVYFVVTYNNMVVHVPCVEVHTDEYK